MADPWQQHTGIGIIIIIIIIISTFSQLVNHPITHNSNCNILKVLSFNGMSERVNILLDT